MTNKPAYSIADQISLLKTIVTAIQTKILMLEKSWKKLPEYKDFLED